MNCPSCGHENPDRAKFCLECGGAFSLRCSSCKVELPAAAKFCLECGTTPAAAPAETAGRPDFGRAHEPAEERDAPQSRAALASLRRAGRAYAHACRAGALLDERLGRLLRTGQIDRWLSLVDRSVAELPSADGSAARAPVTTPRA